MNLCLKKKTSKSSRFSEDILCISAIIGKASKGFLYCFLNSLNLRTWTFLITLSLGSSSYSSVLINSNFEWYGNLPSKLIIIQFTIITWQFFRERIDAQQKSSIILFWKIIKLSFYLDLEYFCNNFLFEFVTENDNEIFIFELRAFHIN